MNSRKQSIKPLHKVTFWLESFKSKPLKYWEKNWPILGPQILAASRVVINCSYLKKKKKQHKDFNVHPANSIISMPSQLLCQRMLYKKWRLIRQSSREDLHWQVRHEMLIALKKIMKVRFGATTQLMNLSYFVIISQRLKIKPRLHVIAI